MTITSRLKVALADLCINDNTHPMTKDDAPVSIKKKSKGKKRKRKKEHQFYKHEFKKETCFGTMQATCSTSAIKHINDNSLRSTTHLKS